MTLKWTAAGLTAAMIAMAGGAPATVAWASGEIRLAQAVDADPVAQAEAILKDAGSLGSLSPDDLKSRSEAALNLLQNQDLPKKIRIQLKRFYEAAQNELQTRNAGAQQSKQPAQTEQQPAQAEQPSNKKSMAEAEAILGSAGDMASLPEKNLRRKMGSAQRLMNDESLPGDVRAQLKSFYDAASQELETRHAKSQQPEQPAQTEQQPAQTQQQPAQAEQPPAPSLNTKSMAEAQAILGSAGDMGSLAEKNLRRKMGSAQRLMNDESLPEDVRAQLKSYYDAASQELETRHAKSQQPEQPAQTEQQPAQTGQQPAQSEQPSAPDQKSMEEAQAILDNAGKIASMTDQDLKQNIDSALGLLKEKRLPKRVKAELQSFYDTANREYEARHATAQEPQQPAIQAAPQPEQAAPQGVDNSDVAAAGKLLSDQRAMKELTDADLQARIRAAKKLRRTGRLPDDVRQQLNSLIETSQAEVLARKAPAEAGTEQQSQVPVEKAPTPPPSTAENRAVDNPNVSPEAEAKARDLLSQSVALEKLKDEEIRGRLVQFRDLLETGNLDRATERKLREELKNEREFLRARVAARELEQQPPGMSAQQQNAQPNKQWNNGPVEITRLNQRPTREEMNFVVNDRRPLRSLNEVELNRRILVYRELLQDDRYTDEQLLFIRGELDKARLELKRRFENDKLVRFNDLDRRRRDRQLNIDININLAPGGGRPRPPMIWAAEQDESELEQQLVARPLRPLPQRYPREVIYDRPETVLTRPEVRDSLPGIEIDTINFGFNEAFVREEEVQNLDAIATIIERIVTAHPREIFVIEGHTDAVGSDAYNLALSKQRAEAVRKILLDYYNIGPENLITVGLGERYLKIPTPEPEQENRRVTVRRATPLLSDYNDQQQDQ